MLTNRSSSVSEDVCGTLLLQPRVPTPRCSPLHPLHSHLHPLSFSSHSTRSSSSSLCFSSFSPTTSLSPPLAHRCTIFLCHLNLEIYMIDIDIQISISERSSGWATNYSPLAHRCTIFLCHLDLEI